MLKKENYPLFKALKEFKSAFEDMGIKVNRMILFGSYTQGTYREGSDIDVAVILEDFKNINLLKRLKTIGLAFAKAKIIEPIEALGYTEAEFSAKGKGTFLGDEIRSKGIEIR